MNWIDILKKNDKEFQKEVPKKKFIEEVINVDDQFIKNYEDEFDFEYSSKIIDIKIEFKEYIKNLGLPFFDKNRTFIDTSYNFNDYIKYNSNNLIKIKNKVEKENEEYLKELEEDEEIDNYYYDNYEE
jgi:hypothetical protein